MKDDIKKCTCLRTDCVERIEVSPEDTEKAKKKGSIFGDPVIIIE